MVIRLLLIFLCLGVLSTVPGCYVEQQGGRQDEMNRPWNRSNGSYAPSG